MSSDYIEDYFLAKLIGFRENKLNVDFIRKEVGHFRSSQDCLWELALENSATMILVAEYGRKGPKVGSNAVGTSLQFLSLNSTIPSYVLKKYIPRSEKEDKAFKFCLFFDSSETSKRALDETVKLMHPQDILQIVSVNEPKILLSDEIQAYLETKSLPAHHFEWIEPEPKKSVYQMLF
jgi:hypothetical protein